jgi:hypothetical protein
MKSILEMFVDVCTYQASRLSEFSSEVTVTVKIQREARKLLNDEVERAKLKLRDNRVYKFTKYTIQFEQQPVVEHQQAEEQQVDQPQPVVVEQPVKGKRGRKPGSKKAKKNLPEFIRKQKTVPRESEKYD